MKNQENINQVLLNAGKKDNLYLFYYLAIFILFGSLGAFDIVTSVIASTWTATIIFNFIIGLVFSLVAISFFILFIIFLSKPKQLFKIDFGNRQIQIFKARKNAQNIPFENVYFIKDNGENFLNFIFRYGTLKIYTKNGETFNIRNISNSKILKVSLDKFLNLTNRTIYKPNFFKLFFIRIYQFFLNVSLHFIVHKEPKLLQNKPDIVRILKESKLTNVMILSSKTINKRGFLTPYLEELQNNNIDYKIYTDISKNPTLTDCVNAKDFYLKEKCDGVIAIGGGSILDAAKAIIATVNTKKELVKYKGLFKIHHKVPLLIAIPTTCGTGSETTFVSVITDDIKNEKFVITSNKITPKYAILDEELLKSLPLHYIGSTTMDAFTHALEAYLNNSRTNKTKKQSLEALKIIYDNLENAYKNEHDLSIKKNLLDASFIAGKSFNRALVGPIHALAHALGGKYNLEHGYLNAILLPRFLRVYIFDCYKELGEISRYINLSNTDNINYDAKQLILYVEKINKLYNFSDTIDVLKEEEIRELAKKAYKEAHLLYPSKHFVTLEMYEDILVSLLKH